MFTEVGGYGPPQSSPSSVLAPLVLLPRLGKKRKNIN